MLFGVDLGTLAAGTLYLVITALVFAESGLLIGFWLPGDTVLFAAGLISGAPGSDVSLGVLLALVVPAAVLGDAVGYWFGRRAGRPFLERRDGRVLNADNLRRAQDFYDRFGWSAVVAARWFPWGRTFVPILAGTAAMPYGRFTAANIVGALTWGAGLLVLGNAAASIPALRDVAIAIGITAAVLMTLPGVVTGVRARRRRRTAPAARSAVAADPGDRPPTLER